MVRSHFSDLSRWLGAFEAQVEQLLIDPLSQLIS